MGIVQIDHNPSRRQLNVFGFIWLVFFGIVGGVVLRGSGSAKLAAGLWCLAVVVPVLGWTVPKFMRLVYVGMAYLAFPIGLVISFLILAMVYYVVVTPIGLAMRLFGHDPMHRRFDPHAKTYWVPRQQQEDVSRYFRQF